MNAEFKEFLGKLTDEARYGLEHSHQGKPNGNCNASRQLRLIIAAINQFNGIDDGHTIGWASRTDHGEKFGGGT